MSILAKPYEISIWQDVWQGDKFCEQRLGIIGTNEMLYQGRAIEPNLVRNVNGTKKFSFKMYKHFIDATTGEKVDNPFIDWLISERKVKLKYEKDEAGNDIWYDFIIKDVVENSSNYLYTYQLDDALVQELSKNGFGVTLDEQSRNNMGNVEYLATETLKETDWEVESEVFVERVDEALVYVKLPSSLPEGFQVYKLLDDKDDFLNVGLEPKLEENTSIWKSRTVLAFYSSCRNKPHRFQFIYLSNYDKANVSIDKNRQILNKNCQYYIEFEPNKYTVTNADYGFTLPEGFSVVSKTYTDGSDIVNASDSTISTWYRGGRYGFAQKAEYIPLLDRYCQMYSTENDNEGNPIVTHYGYVDNKYEDLEFSTNLVENTEFSNTSGWTGTYSSDGTSVDKAVIETTYGKFIDKDFISTTDVLADKVDTDQTFEQFLNECAPFLKVELKSGNSLVINSGPYHNRTLIGNMPDGSKWAFRAECFSSTGGQANLTFDIDEYTYDTATGHYSAPSNKKITFTTTTSTDKDSKSYTIYTVDTNSFANETDFTKNSKLKIAISGNEGTYYIKNLEFFRVRFDKDNKVVPLESQGTDIENLITTQYRYFRPSELDTATEAKDIHYDYETDTLSYKTYKPVYNINGEKIRAVSAKESNYFNILQSIAETFECWLDLQIIRDDPNQPGAITRKIAKFKNYAGGDNYACFRYGVNLKDIQRTYSSKNIVTKLMVKQNSNEHGENGICTIARAGANPTGDTSIYDFSYFQNMGLMNAHDYIDTMYKIDGAEGPDVNNATSYNIQGYFPRIRAINEQLLDKIDEEIVLKQRLLKLNSDLEVQKAKQSAAASGMEEASESYLQMTGVRPTELVNGKVTITSITLDTENKYGTPNEDKKGHLSYQESDSNPDYILGIFKNDNKIKITASPSSGTTFKKSQTLLITAFPILIINGSEFVQTVYFTLEIKKDETSVASQEQELNIDTEASQVKKYFNEYAEYAAQKHEADIKVPKLESDKNSLQDTYKILVDTIQKLKNHKIALNQLFFTRYSRFIQEGTWIDEKYYDDEKYYNDALSVMYNSCYPQVAYTINTFEVSQLPGYEMFNFNVGEKTWAEDGEFFGFNEDGSPKKEEVIITEKSENLDDPSKNTNKVQNFKNQFQDLFQKITATVQQAQYSTGAYEKGVAEANAIAEDSVGFLREAMSAMTVNLDNPQVMSESTDKSSQLRIVDGKVLIGKRDQNTEEISWTTGLSSDGIAADLINTGRLNTSEIQIYGGDNPTFRWDAKGISAYDYTYFNNVISGVNTDKFVRFDKHGIYGINGGVDADWVPGQNGTTALQEIDQKATFALTWEGLKVTGSTGGTARLGKQNGYIMLVRDHNGVGTFGITEQGKIEANGIKIINGTIGENGQQLASQEDINTVRIDLEQQIKDVEVQAGSIAIYNDKLDGEEGNISWDDIIFLAGKKVENGEIKDEANAVYLAGWTVTNSQLTYEAIGTAGSFGVYPKGLAKGKLDKSFLWPDPDNDSWVMTAGTNFGLTRNGVLYANAGRIGSMTIAETNRLLRSENLVVHQFPSAENIHDGSGWGVPYIDEKLHDAENNTANPFYEIVEEDGEEYWKIWHDAQYTPSDRDSRYLIHYYPFLGEDGSTIREKLEGKTFTLSFELKKMEETNFSPSNGSSISFRYQWSKREDEIQAYQEAKYYFNSSNASEITDQWQKYTATITFKDLPKITDAAFYGCYVLIAIDYRSSNGICVRHIKLEEGKTATAWTSPTLYEIEKSVDGKMDASINNNNFSWEFSPTEGMFMWNGQQHKATDIIPGTSNEYGPTRGAVLSIYNNNGRHELSMKGHIEAESGKLGVLQIAEVDSQSGLKIGEHFTINYNGNMLVPFIRLGTTNSYVVQFQESKIKYEDETNTSKSFYSFLSMRQFININGSKTCYFGADGIYYCKRNTQHSDPVWYYKSFEDLLTKQDWTESNN